MARSPKIRKKKSFMFTTKHYPFTGIMGVVLLVLGAGVLVTSVMGSFSRHGQTDITVGYYGFFAALLNLLGLFGGIEGLRERDTFKVVSIVAISGNALVIAAWLFLIIMGMH